MKQAIEFGTIDRKTVGEPMHPGLAQAEHFESWERAQAEAYETAEPEERMPSGWWLMPVAGLGLLFWVALGWMVFG
ncbi:hypothetical protein NHN26_11785 [Rhodovulum tesquicola]|uniref:Uncharacterized protein n=1 Tax=Rhodovulum steppense TaxID=540251 RepID=A0A4R1YWB6_9RHOB|nr:MULTISPECIES: hypothetical protein [Rhodovulum]MCO8145906.1 hypothetical protein [Rhodovulum tesquicola]TCM85459.1 hypothetical protein EV216_10733 [Rhodovulum steppense]